MEHTFSKINDFEQKLGFPSNLPQKGSNFCIGGALNQ
jgi:hypothetical protein